MANSTNPCGQASYLSVHIAFQYYMSYLYGMTNGNSEYAIPFKPNGSVPVNDLSYAISIYQGPNNQYSADIPIPTGTIGGLAHSHWGTGSLSIFSPGDLYGMYQLLVNNKMANPSTFFSVVTTGHGTTYMLMIDDVNKFSQFAQNSFGNASDAQGADDLLSAVFSIYGITPNSSISKNEMEFLNFIGAANTGLTLFKGNTSNFNSWNRLGINGANVVTNPCP